MYWAAIFGFIGVLPQLIYWHHATGSFVYDVGSAWDFLKPHFRVLFGFEKGWFVYTPVTICFIAGMFYIKNMPFKKAVIWFCLLNIYIVIAWRDWRYGGSYSTRALVQSYPVFALPFTAFISMVLNKKLLKFSIIPVAAYLIFVNLFQIKQYFNTVLHYNDMNMKYYSKIYLKKVPSPIETSLFDTKEWLNNENRYKSNSIIDTNCNQTVVVDNGGETVLYKINNIDTGNKKGWLKVEATFEPNSPYKGNYLTVKLTKNDSVKTTKVRMWAAKTDYHTTATYVKVPPYFNKGKAIVAVKSGYGFKGVLKKLRLNSFKKD